MYRRRVIWAAVCLLGLSGAWASNRARADVPFDPPDSKRVPVTIELDWGPLAGRTSRSHEVAQGDTLRALARTYYGDAKAWPVIAEANPSRVRPPDGIRVGDTLLIPSPATGYEAFWVTTLGRPGPSLRVHERALPVGLSKGRQGGGRLLFLPVADAVPVLATLASGKVHVFEGKPATGHLVVLGHNPEVTRDDPVQKLHVRFRFTGIGPEGVAVEKTVVRLDGEGRELPPHAEGAAAPAGATAPALMSIVGDISVEPPVVKQVVDRWPVWIGLLVAIVGLGIVLTIARRRRTRAPQDPGHDG